MAQGCADADGDAVGDVFNPTSQVPSDFNGDGKADYCRRVGENNGTNSHVSCTLSTGTGFGATLLSGVLDWGYDTGRAWTDFNGDGKADFCRRVGENNGTNSHVSCTLSTGTGFGATLLSGVLDWGYDTGRAWTDFNGDGKTDFCRRVGIDNGSQSRLSCTLSTGSGFGATVSSDVVDWGYDTGRAWTDFNGDGKTDFCRRVGENNGTNSHVSCTLSTGTGFGATLLSGVLDWGYDTGRAWTDFNGDGKTEFCRRVGIDNGSQSRLSCTLSTGSGFGATVSSDVVDWGYGTGVAWVGTLPSGSRFTPLTPARILDTRIGNGAPATQVAAGGVVELQVTGRGAVPSDATAVVLNVTSVAMSGAPASYLTAWPTGATRPEVSNVNYLAGDVVPNLVTVKVGAGGKVSLYNAIGAVDVIADVAGYYATSAESAFTALQPARILDTRIGNGAPTAPVGPAGVVELQVTDRGGVPAGASGVVLNVTAVGLSASPSSFITAYPTGSTLPLASNLNLVAGQTVPNLVVAKIGAGGKVSLFNKAGQVHLIADVAGYYGATGSTFTPVDPQRLLDTRTGNGAPAVRIAAGGTVELQVTGRGGVTNESKAVVLNVTAVNLASSTSSYLTAWPTGQPMPLASNLNMVTGQVVPNLVVAKIGTGGKVSITNNSGNIDILADISGYFSG